MTLLYGHLAPTLPDTLEYVYLKYLDVFHLLLKIHLWLKNYLIYILLEICKNMEQNKLDKMLELLVFHHILKLDRFV